MVVSVGFVELHIFILKETKKILKHHIDSRNFENVKKSSDSVIFFSFPFSNLEDMVLWGPKIAKNRPKIAPNLGKMNLNFILDAFDIIL